jgi:hypothetical protein
MRQKMIFLASLTFLIFPCCLLSARDDASLPPALKLGSTLARMDEAKFSNWQARWESNITSDARNRYCDTAMGEDIGWLMAPFLDGFRNGYLTTGDTKWLDMLVDWSDAWVKRAIKEPDGFLGWPKLGAAGTKVDNLDSFNADSMLGEAMALRPIVLLSAEILKRPLLRAKFGAKAENYLKLSGQIYEKWDQRGAWRETKSEGMISIVLPYGIDSKTGGWTSGYAKRNDPNLGFSHPNNKANAVARWLLAMSDATGKAVYRERAEQWFRLMKSRMRLQPNGTYLIWNYWEPGGPWDYNPDRSPKHWIGIHPTVGYYAIDAEAIVDAFEHKLVFDDQDLEHLVATALAEKRFWPALAAYNLKIQEDFEKTMKPDSWDGLSMASHYLALQAEVRRDAK